MATKSWKFAETSHKTTVGLNKTDVKFQKELESLERQKNTSMNNIANHQQAMKMSWKRLEERRAESPTLSQRREKKEEQKNNKKGLLFQTNTKLYVDKTPSIYHPETGTSDDDAFTRFRSKQPVKFLTVLIPVCLLQAILLCPLMITEVVHLQLL